MSKSSKHSDGESSTTTFAVPLTSSALKQHRSCLAKIATTGAHASATKIDFISTCLSTNSQTRITNDR